MLIINSNIYAKKKKCKIEKCREGKSLKENKEKMQKKQEVPIETLDKETIRRILIMLEEELKINEKKMEEKMQTLEISLDNIQIYQKEIELMKKTES